MILRSPHSFRPNAFPFRFPQEPTTVKRYVNHWKQFIFYSLRTTLLDESTRDRIYGIHFTPNQLAIIQQLLEMLNEYEDEKNGHHRSGESDDDIDEEENEDFHQYDLDDEDEADENDNEILQEVNVREIFAHDDEDEDDDIDPEYSSFLTRAAEKILQLSIAFITEHFRFGDNLHSPLVHFADVMGISNKTGQWNEAYNYTSYVAGLTWMYRFLVMEYALPNREYPTLGWPSYEAYDDPGERLKRIHDDCLILGSFKPMNRLIRVLNYGQDTIKKTGRPCMLT
jgi:hypothetical protein